MTKKEEKAREVLANRYAAFAKRVRTLTGHVLDQRAYDRDLKIAFAENQSADDFAAKIAAREPVGRALHPQKENAIKEAAAQAQVTVDHATTKLAEAGWDMNVAAPYPSYNDFNRKSKAATHNLFSSLTETRDGFRSSYGRGEPHMVQMSEKGVARFIRQAEEMAAAQYDAFICKMVAKIGPTAVDAAINGDHIWSYSILIVEHKDGTVQRWKTQQITNTSVHGLRFPQWPSRIVK